jgi:MSHA biogenesis protein MshO
MPRAPKLADARDKLIALDLLRAGPAVSRPRAGQRGMTLIELVVVITLSVIVVTFMANFIIVPMNAYSGETQRALLSDAADGALRLLGRDLRAALPNSVRVSSSGSVVALEFIATIDGARYLDSGPLSNASLWLDFTTADAAFSTTVPFSEITLPYSSTSNYLVIYNVGVSGANAYAMSNVITPAGTSISITAGSTANQNLVTLNPGFQFSYGSPGKRVYLASGPVSYLCDTGAGTLTRYAGYAILATQPTSATSLTAAGASSGLVATNVSACQFTYSAGAAQRDGLASLALQLSSNGQSVQLLHQVHLVNTP